ncbi:hypothetical protein HC928_10235 [bacterium]|nr:hypothetical protein [bacterium]
MNRKLIALIVLALVALAVVPLAAQDDMMEGTTFTVTLQNVSAPARVAEVFNTPDGADEAGPAFPGQSYTFSFAAEPGDYLNFATMLVQSNDLFFAPVDTGIRLFDDMGSPLTGDITEQVLLWDAGTEVNEEPGVGENQAPRQAGPNTGEDELGLVLEIADVMDGFSYPAVNELINVSITHEDGTFTVVISNISEESALAGPISPGVFAVHGRFPFLFAEGSPASTGIEAVAEDGNPALLIEEANALRIAGPISPGAFAIHTPDVSLFTVGEPASAGIEANAEDGAAAPLVEELTGVEGVLIVEAFTIPDGAEEAGPAFPGQSYTFTFTANEGEVLSFATMFVQSNDLFFAPNPEGIALFDDMGSPIEGDITALVPLWDAGTEVNEEPGVGENQAPRQAGPNTGDDEMGVVSLVADVMDGFAYPAVENVIRVTITVHGMGDMGGEG